MRPDTWNSTRAFKMGVNAPQTLTEMSGMPFGCWRSPDTWRSNYLKTSENLCSKEWSEPWEAQTELPRSCKEANNSLRGSVSKNVVLMLLVVRWCSLYKVVMSPGVILAMVFLSTLGLKEGMRRSAEMSVLNTTRVSHKAQCEKLQVARNHCCKCRCETARFQDNWTIPFLPSSGLKLVV